MFFTNEADRASAQAAKARQDASEAGSSAASSARNLGAAVLATLAEATAALPPLGKVYVPEGSYREMTEWALPAARINRRCTSPRRSSQLTIPSITSESIR